MLNTKLPSVGASLNTSGSRSSQRLPPSAHPQAAGSRQPFSSACSHSCNSNISSARARVVALAEPAGRDRLKAGGFSPTSPQAWDNMRRSLQESGVKMVSPQEMIFAAERGNIVIVDVRPEADYDKGHIPDSLNVPFYRPITGWEPFKIARRLGYAAFGVLNGTEINPDFAQEVRAIMASDGAGKTLVLYCSQGGVLESTETHQRGWQTRSLVAAYDLLQDGMSNIQVLKDGYTGWTNAGRDIEVLEYEEDGAADEGAEDKVAA